MKRVVATLAFAAAGTAQAAEPSFDCAKADGAAETLICRDDELAAMDRELARLWRLAVEGPNMAADRLPTLRAEQRGWIKGRNDCWKAPDLRACVRDETALRIHRLRQAHADARAEDEAGISLGPFSADCAGFGAGIGATFVNSDPGAAALEWRDRTVGLERVVSASGARYAGTSFDGPYQFWIKGDAATFETPEGAWECRLSVPG